MELFEARKDLGFECLMLRMIVAPSNRYVALVGRLKIRDKLSVDIPV